MLPRFYTIFFPARIRCFACDYVGKSRVSNLYRGLTLAWLPFSLSTINLLQTSYLMSRRRGAALVIGPFILASLIFSKRAHRCPKCDSELHTREP